MGYHNFGPLYHFWDNIRNSRISEQHRGHLGFGSDVYLRKCLLAWLVLDDDRCLWVVGCQFFCGFDCFFGLALSVPSKSNNKTQDQEYKYPDYHADDAICWYWPFERIVEVRAVPSCFAGAESNVVAASLSAALVDAVGCHLEDNSNWWNFLSTCSTIIRKFESVL